MSMELPKRPRMVLRVGFAGRRELSVFEKKRLRRSLLMVLQTVGQRLAALAVGIPVEAGKEPKVCHFYAREKPLLRLVTGLCEGADAIAAETLRKVRVKPDHPASPPPNDCLETELAAVLPFDLTTYRESRPADFLAKFDAQAARCAWIMELDGIYEKPEPDTDLAKKRRSQAYRAQSTFLLRNTDILVAVPDIHDQGRAGGTIETIRAAMALKIPVVVISVDEGADHVRLVQPEDFYEAIMEQDPPECTLQKETLKDWVTQIVADPDIAANSKNKKRRKERQYGLNLLKDFFEEEKSLLSRFKIMGMRTRGRTWAAYETLFARGKKPERDPELLAVYAQFRARARKQAALFSGAYRGAFLINYFLAVLAVTLALLGLAVMYHHYLPQNHPMLPGVLPFEETLLVLAIAKLFILAFISFNTYVANENDWNDRAVDYRYLAERLRSMFYLPLAGSQRPPQANHQKFSARGIRQSAVSWLFEAIVRSTSPAMLADSYPGTPAAARTATPIIIRLQPLSTIENIRKSWVANQTAYHRRNSNTMSRMFKCIRMCSSALGLAVIGIVAFDVVFIFGETMNYWGDSIAENIRRFLPELIIVSAIIPTMTTALNGIRFQSECQRLAERSEILWRKLDGNPPAKNNADSGARLSYAAEAERLAGRMPEPEQVPGKRNLGCHSLEVLRYAERLAEDLAHEADEWSVTCAKDIPDMS